MFEPLHAQDDSTATARRLLLTGNYQEAAERFAKIDPPTAEATIGLARAKASLGQYAQAEKLLREAYEKTPADGPDAARLAAELALLAFQHGDDEDANTWRGRADSSKSLLARWVEAELWRAGGKLDEANRAYRGLIDYYNAHDVSDPDELLLIGKAAAVYARWNRLSDQFSFLVNELYPDILQLDANYWPARLETGQLFAEKFNQAQASREFQQALAINPQAAEVHAALAHLALQTYDMDQAQQAIDRALAINPNLLAARHAKADLLMANFQPAEAASYLEEALRLNPLNEQTLGRLAAAYAVLDGYRPEGPIASRARVDKLIAQVVARNPRAGEFFYTLGARLEERRRFDVAAHFLHEALARMPRMIGPHAALGMLHMRLGEEDQARKILAEAFQADPFNLRVSNTLKVLEVLDDYQTLETEHFLIRFDPQKDKILARYAAQHLERVYPELCALLGYEPRGKSLFEIFNQARNTGGHGWFSARMVGLPYVGTVGACAGKMVALASPTEGKHRFNWARVLKHEFVHVINLQQTNFNIPHWFTEALAVWNEGYPRPQEWNALLVDRVPKGEIFNLDTINLGFVRPETSDNWQMAYCQAELYAEYLLKKFGDDAFARLLAAYADNLDTPAALKRCFHIDQKTFETGYQEYLKEVVRGLGAYRTVAPRVGLAELERQVAARPDDADLLARLALAHLERRDYPAARKHARRALARQPRHAMASFVLARLQSLIGDEDAARKILEAAHDDASPDEQIVGLLAALVLKAGDFDRAAKLYQNMAQRQPDDIRWPKGLARVYLLSKQDGKLQEVLVRLAHMDADDVNVRKKLAAMALARENYAEAAAWAQRALEIDVMDAQIHQMLGQSLLKIDNPREARAEYEVALELSPGQPELLLGFAKACLAMPDRERARAALDELLNIDPDHEEAKSLLETLHP